MVLPPNAQQVIDQIIVATDDASPELHLPMRDELTAQLEALVESEIRSTLPADKKYQFQQLLKQEPVNPDQVDAFISQNIPAFDQMLHKAVNNLKILYLD